MKTQIIILAILLIPLVSAAAPIKSATFTNDGLIILSPIYDFKKMNTDFTYNVHVSNQSNGMQLTNAHVVCVLEIYNSTGVHLLTTNMTWIPADLEWETTIDKGNFTNTGFYSRVIECNYTHGTFYLGDTSEFTFEVTETGKEPPANGIIVFFLIMYLLIISFLIYTIIISISHLINLDMDIKDLTIIWSSYFVLVGTFVISTQYLNNQTIENFLQLLVKITGYTNLILPAIIFLICLIKRKLNFEKENPYG